MSTMRRILACTDGSPKSEITLRYARLWAERLQMQVKVLAVEDLRVTQGPMVTGYYGPVGMAPSPAYPSFYDDLIKAVRAQRDRAIKQAQTIFEGSGIQVEYLTREGIVHLAIIEEARSADMIFLGRRGEHSEWSDEPLGTTVQRVLRRSMRPVLVTAGPLRDLGRVLVAYDGSPPANRTLRAVLTLAERGNLPLTIVTVAHDENHRDESQRTQDEARELAAAYHQVSSDFRLLIGHDHPAALLEQAVDSDCQLIAMGAYGRSRLREWLLGSTTTTILERSPLPILLIR
jgi:nucleotide-binding universal stress UspA family protein